ncbi:enterobactin ABC transporter permease [Paracoccus suum]|uniref:Enterobactin ABC transporter permease n=1 Tax=Paracoccus suum TaxID=2259340 RepID=A0A344PNV7_9RHOB|nr:iron chelate uptake ABC transporter family permease subunit [Paracoccus suum]AXC51062.1 enterobactin ABC transporter permease [Paracoccus suum]
MRPSRVPALAALAALLLLACGFWLFQGLGSGNRSFILQLRATKLAALLTVSVSIGVATVLFQTVAANRVLTPSIMGFDALYVLMQTLLVGALGIAGFANLPPAAKFAAEILAMAGLATLLFSTLLGRGAQDIPRTILTGVILGVLFRTLSQFAARVMDPNEFAVVQSISYASFGRVQAGLLPYATGLAALAVAGAMWLAPRLDVMALGRESAVSLGLPFNRMVMGTLALVAVLVAVSTALVGPVPFFGLIVAGLAHALTGSARHARLLPAAGLIAAIILVTGQMLFERVLGQATTLSVVVEFAGGLFFLFLLLKGRIR